MKILLTFGGEQIEAKLLKNKTAQDFAKLLPLKLSMSDYNSTEKIADLPRKLYTETAPSGYEPEVGDICLYAPWGNLAIFYKGFEYSPGLVKVGSIDSGIMKLKKQAGRFTMTIEVKGK